MMNHPRSLKTSVAAPAAQRNGRIGMTVMSSTHSRGPVLARLSRVHNVVVEDAVVLPLQPAPEAIELRHLRAFVAVAQELNFSRAADRLYVSQPALSRQVRALERLVGCTLLRRSTHRVELTLAGEALLSRAEDLIADLDGAVAATRSVGGANVERVTRLWATLVDVSAVDSDLSGLRGSVEELHARFAPPASVDIRAVQIGGVPALRCIPTGPLEPSRRRALFLHGGGFVAGSAFGYRHLAGALAVVARQPVLVPEYRLAPEHPFPAALDDAVNAYLGLLASGHSAADLAVVGDSSGAALALSLLFALRERGQPLPSRMLLMSPWLDLAAAAERARSARPDGVALEATARFAQLYLSGHRSDDPLVDLLSNDFSGLPQMLVQAGTGDMLAAEARQVVKRAREAGVDATLALFPADTHDFHLFWSFLPEASDAVHQGGEFLAASEARKIITSA
jgi:epsilon-lactone hydrolase